MSLQNDTRSPDLSKGVWVCRFGAPGDSTFPAAAMLRDPAKRTFWKENPKKTVKEMAKNLT